ncbi:pyridoxal phosphate-dependent decarboxylase family protein [Burkholderia ubonensis]|uniref:Aspartate aminotransferase family protein n=1 Tax=Burkholderia ubonensis TaxID=101571 RepID=A0AB74CX50_9BURK|nr:aminotransferase class V-fold PLP-dependent enzyme [Burkholderia ubonensis]PAJ78149.1 aspartate aminotransferase family protein [Burkholderia ubonensis]PAJ84483.1 aspartate aminotransferase family protein [Burkholderia ubonensis]PAJ91346.1 aspartate aminotransferase family protein [Burkholderia ubonensis]PAK04618.1 aspartate aminotransferase family protein [Burkholderia ubonensis]PAK12112.1 aspartate aminotransferase family protein [Burkholderia ubonensis]
MDELALVADADRRAHAYLTSVDTRRVFPDAAALANLAAFDEPLPEHGKPADDVLRLLDGAGSPATVASNGPNYFGFVIGAALPAAAAAERLMLAWDQCASSFDNSPVAATIERQAARWVVDALDLPRDSAVGFGTSATACTLVAIAAARRALLARKGWDFEGDGLIGAPEVKVVISELAHITVKKALRVLGFGMKRIVVAPVDAHGRIDPDRLPPLDDMTIFCMQAGEVNTGEFDPFAALIPRAKAAGAWVHVDGAFGLWARASSKAALTDGIDGADSWTTDGHKWLNTPYDGAMVICRDADALAVAMNAAAAYSSAERDAQMNLNLEFSRRARGIPIWAALRSLGRDGVAAMIDRHCALASRVATGLRAAGYDVLSRVVLNQVLVRAATDAQTVAIREAAQASGEVWFGPTVWQGRPAFRISVSSWRTEEAHVDRLVDLLAGLYKRHAA